MKVPQCSHLFHSECITDWIKRELQANREPSCPTCRRQFEAVREATESFTDIDLTQVELLEDPERSEMELAEIVGEDVS